MGITALSGPRLTFGLTRTSTGGVQEYNEQRGADMADCGHAMMDPRPEYTYRPGSGVTRKTWGWHGGVGAVDCKPGTFTVGSVAASQQPVSGTALTLATGSSGCVTIGVTLAPASNPGNPVSVIALDSTYATVPVGLAFGQTGTESLWDPQVALSRGITIEKSSTTSDDSAGTYTIQGYDIYGYAMTETITGTSSTGSTSYNSNKNFKYIQSITPGGTIGATAVSVHPNNTYGFPMAVWAGHQVELWMGLSSNIAQVTTQTTLITFGATLTPTATTPDVRGRWASTNLSSNSSNYVYIRVRPRPQDIQSMSATYSSTGTWLVTGAPHYSS
jgi:hypothetical protein